MTPKLPINLNSLLYHRTIESQRVEYKAGWNPEAVLHNICAFANDFHNLGGGYALHMCTAGKVSHVISGEVTGVVAGVVTPEVGTKSGPSRDQEPILQTGEEALPFDHFPDVTKMIRRTV